MDFATRADYKMKSKEGKKRNKFSGPWNRKVTVIPIVIGALGTILKGMVNAGVKNSQKRRTIVVVVVVVIV